MALTPEILILAWKTKASRFCGGCHFSEILDTNLCDWCDAYELLLSKHEISQTFNPFSLPSSEFEKIK